MVCITIASSWKPSLRKPNTSRCKLILAGAATFRTAIPTPLALRHCHPIQTLRQGHPLARGNLLGPLLEADSCLVGQGLDR